MLLERIEGEILMRLVPKDDFEKTQIGVFLVSRVDFNNWEDVTRAMKEMLCEFGIKEEREIIIEDAPL